MKRSKAVRLALIASLFGLAVLATACSSSTKNASGTVAPSKQAQGYGAASGTDAGGRSAVTVANSSLGKILAGPDGRTLYGFTNDINASSTCYSTCAAAWPPLTTGAQWTVAPGLDTGIFSTVTRDDGTSQLAVGKWPLYYYSGDTSPGDTSGQGSGGVWFVVGIDGKLITNAKSGAGAPASNAPYPGQTGAAYPGAGGTPPSAGTAGPVKTGQTNLGPTLVDSTGHTLYGITKDSSGTPTCTAACATVWPPLLVSGSALPSGLDPSIFSVVDTPTGQKQLKAGKWPLYRFSGDQKAGDTNGQGSGGVWFAVSPTGKLIKP